ncbi:unnamed protein product [Discula destructiva]
MDRIRSILSSRTAAKDTRDVDPDEYEPLRTSSDDVVEAPETAGGEGEAYKAVEVPFSWFEYTIFALVGMAMLWAWNMFLAASPYFNFRFLAHPTLSRTFQSSVLTVSTITNLVATLVLTKLQRTANYANRIKLGLVINTAAFVLLTISTTTFRDVSPDVYLAFVLTDVCLAALATGLFQNGAFAFAASFGRGEYTQAVMVGQALAGVLPALAQMISVLAIPPAPESDPDNEEKSYEPDTISRSAFLYFLTAVIVSLITLASFFPLAAAHKRLTASRSRSNNNSDTDAEDQQQAPGTRQVVGFVTLLRKLHWEAGAAAICFVATLAFFPVFTGKILSTHDAQQPHHARLFDPEVFIPLGFLCWNAGDLGGRMLTGGKLNARVRRQPVVLFLFGCARFCVLPLYLLCNLHGSGAVVESDLFYLGLVQLPFGLSNGWLASNAMMAAAEVVDEGEREAAGGFMGLCLVAGLAVGSLLSFSVTDI